MKPKRLKTVVGLVFFAITYLVYFTLYVEISERINIREDTKTIVIYTPLFGRIPWWQAPYDYRFTHHDGEPCEERSCQITYDKRYVRNSDAVLFHARDMIDLSPHDMKILRRQNINNRWIWLMHENPHNTYLDYKLWDDTFNWTVTYHPSSDVFMPYYDILSNRPGIDKLPKPDTNFAKGKTRKCLAMVSNCDEFRLELIRNLKKYINVDVFGKCKNKINPELKLDCPKNSAKCSKLQQQYKFYIAFENGFCDGYVTEKYYRNGLQRNLVPIVFSGGDFNNKNVAIPHSYINVLDFKDTKSLADYLDYLDKNDTAYNEYHQWKYNYRVNNSLNFMCGVCKLLWDQEKQQQHKTVKLTEFWSVTKTCKSYNDQMFEKYLDTPMKPENYFKIFSNYWKSYINTKSRNTL